MNYGHYVLEEFGWPLVAAILTATCFLIISLLATGRRRASGLVALGMFISIVVHMLVASLFGLYVLNTPRSDGSGTESKVELSSSVPPMAESLLSQDMRAHFTATTKPDLRELSAKKEPQKDPILARAARLNMDLKHGPLPEPMQEKMEMVTASLAKEKITDALSRSEETIPDVNKAKLVALTPLKTAGETASVKPVPRELPRQTPQKLQRDPLAAPVNRMRNVAPKEAQRAWGRDAVEIASIPHGGRISEEMLHTQGSAGKVDALEVKAEQIRGDDATGRMDMNRTGEPARAMDVAHQGAATPDAPAASVRVRELKGAPDRAAKASLSDATPMIQNVRPRVDAAAQQGDSSRMRFPDEPVRMTDTQRTVAGPAGDAVAAEPVVDTQRELTAGRSGQTATMDEASLNTPKASISLQGRPGAGEPSRGSPSAGEAAPVGSDRPALHEQLLAIQGVIGTQPLVDVAGFAAAIQAVRMPSAMTAQRSTHDSFEGIASVTSGMAQDNVPDGNWGKVARHSVDFTTAGNDAAGAGERTPFDVPGARSQAVTLPAGDAHELASATASSAMMSMVDLGGAAAPEAAQASGHADEKGKSGGVPDGRRHEWATGKNQIVGNWGQPGDGAFSQRPDGGGVLSGTAGAHHSLADDAADLSVGGLSGTTAAHVDAAIIDYSGAVTGVGATVADILPGTVQEMVQTGTGSLAGGGSESQPARDSLSLKLEKADLGISRTGVQGARSQLSMPTVARGGDNTVSLADAEGLTAAQPRGMKGSGIGQDSVLPVKPGSAAGDEVRVVFGASGQELAAVGMDKGDRSTVSMSSKTTSEMTVAKAGGSFIPDGAPAGGGVMEFDSSSLSSSAGRPQARMDIDLNAGGGGQGGLSARPTGSDKGHEAPRLLISDELASVPKTVPEKALYRLRSPEKRKDIIRELGGSDKTEHAVEEALIWLAKAQSDDGRWDVDGFKTLSRCGGAGDRGDEDVALTGLSLLAYLGAGYTHVKGEHKESVRKALNWLVDGQKSDGNLQREGQMYGQAMATVALCESYSLTGDKRLLEPIEKAVDFILKAQNPGAGWRYEPRKDSDTSVTGWQVLALKSAMIAGIKISPQHFQWVEAWLDGVRRGKEGGLYAYMPGHGGTPTMTAEGWFCQLMMEEKTRLRGQSETIPYLMAHQPVWSPQDHTVNLYFWYYTTLALHMSGAPEFAAWNKALMKALLTGQVARGAAQGSWDPVCVLGERGGRVYTTATAALCLEVYYRYLPFYKQR